MKLTPKAMRVLAGCHWPGKVRGPENGVERIATMTTGSGIPNLSFPCHDKRCPTQVLHPVARPPEWRHDVVLLPA